MEERTYSLCNKETHYPVTSPALNHCQATDGISNNLEGWLTDQSRGLC